MLFLEHIYSGVNTGQKSRNEVEADISSRIYRIKRLFDSNLCKTNEVLEDMKKQYDNQIQRIFNVVRDSVAELENAGVFSQGEYKFTDSVWWKVTLGNISSDQLISDVRVSIVDRTTRTRRVRNAKKDEWGSSWNPFKKFGSLFMESEVEVEKKVDGSYKTTQIMSRIINYTRDIEEKGKQMQNSFVENLDKQKEKVNELVDRILKEVSNFLEDIRNQEMRIESLGGSIIQLDEEIRNCNITYAWLNSLKRKIEEV